MADELEAMARAGLRADNATLKLSPAAFAALNETADALGDFPEASVLVEKIATFWNEFDVAPNVINYLWILAGRPPFMPRAKPEQLRRALADAVREAITCECGAGMARVHAGEHLSDHYACASCGRQLTVEWHALQPFYTASS